MKQFTKPTDARRAEMLTQVADIIIHELQKKHLEVSQLELARMIFEANIAKTESELILVGIMTAFIVRTILHEFRKVAVEEILTNIVTDKTKEGVVN